jgi:hypothetical protein
MPALHPSCGAATQRVRQVDADRIWFGGRCGLRAGVPGGVRLETDPATDPHPYPTMLVNWSVSGGPAAVTDPCLGVSPWGIGRYGGARR